MEGNRDFISRLPNPILHHILGLLKIKHAVQSCVLSKRWEHLWTSLPFLSFQFNDFFPMLRGSDSEDIVEKTAASKRFISFVTTFLMRREPLNLELFFLSCDALCPEYRQHPRDWVHYVVQHRTIILHLHFDGPMPFCVFTSPAIEELNIRTCIVDISGTVSLPKLHKLSIRETGVVENLQLKNLLSGCRVLDYLWLQEFHFNESEIYHDNLRHMIFFICRNIEIETPLLISAPNLITLWYDMWSPETTINLPSVFFARYVVSTLPPIPSWQELAAFLCGLVNVEILKIQVLPRLQQDGAVLPELPKFEKLWDFTIGATLCMSCSSQLLTWIIAHSPNLRKLTFVQEEDCDCEGSTSESSLSAVIAKCTTLEVVEVECHTRNKMVKQLVAALNDRIKDLHVPEIQLY